MLDLTGKTVLVTGGSRGIVAATVSAVSAAGADVVVHYNRGRAADTTLFADDLQEQEFWSTHDPGC